MDSDCFHVHPVSQSYPPDSSSAGQINATHHFIYSNAREKKVKREQMLQFRVQTINSFKFIENINQGTEHFWTANTRTGFRQMYAVCLKITDSFTL